MKFNCFAATSATSTGDVEGKIAELQAQAQQDRLKLENKVGFMKEYPILTFGLDS